MANKIFKTVVDDLEPHVGDILALGITKKAVKLVDATVVDVTADEMIQALNVHIFPSLHSFMSHDKSAACVRQIKKKLEVLV